MLHSSNLPQECNPKTTNLASTVFLVMKIRWSSLLLMDPIPLNERKPIVSHTQPPSFHLSQATKEDDIRCCGPPEVLMGGIFLQTTAPTRLRNTEPYNGPTTYCESCESCESSRTHQWLFWLFESVLRVPRQNHMVWIGPTRNLSNLKISEMISVSGFQLICSLVHPCWSSNWNHGKRLRQIL